MTARLRPVLVAPAAIFATAWAVIAHYAVLVHTLQPDEVIPIAGSRHLLADPLAAFGSGTQLSGRGLERGVAITFAVVQAVLGNTADAYWTQHVLVAGLVAATSLVVWSWGRELGLATWQAAVAAGLSVCVPWVILGTSFLNSAGAYCLTPLALYAIWRATVRPGLGRDVVALAALLLLGCWRVGNVVVAVAFPVAIVLHALYDRAPGAGVGRAARGLPARVWREHPLLVGLGVLALLALAVGGTHWLVGGYSTRPATLTNFRMLLRADLAALAVGTAIVPVVIALAWSVRSLVRPSTPALGAFAAVAVSAFLVLCYVASTQGIEERYLAPVAPVVLLAFVVALARREAPVLLVAVSGVLVARLVAINGPGSDLFGPYQYFQSTAVAFFRRVVLGKVSLAIPFTDHHVLTTVVVAAVVLAVAGVALPARRRGVVLAVLALGAGAWGAAAGLYALHQFVDQAAYKTLTFRQQAWIDGHAGPGSHVALVPAGLEVVERELAAFNRSLGSPYRPRTLDLAAADQQTGALPAGTPRWVVRLDGFQPQGLDATPVARSDYLPVQAVLQRVRSPRLVYTVLGGAPFTVRVFGSGCMRITFQPFAGTRRWRLSSPGGAASGTVADTAPVTVRRPLHGPEDFVLTGGATVLSVARGC